MTESSWYQQRGEMYNEFLGSKFHLNTMTLSTSALRSLTRSPGSSFDEMHQSCHCPEQPDGH